MVKSERKRRGQRYGAPRWLGCVVSDVEQSKEVDWANICDTSNLEIITEGFGITEDEMAEANALIEQWRNELKSE